MSKAGRQQFAKIVFVSPSDLSVVKVLTADETVVSVSVPTKYQNNLWIKKGTFVVTDMYKIVQLLNEGDMEYFIYKGLWPFNESNSNRQETDDSDNETKNDNETANDNTRQETTTKNTNRKMDSENETKNDNETVNDNETDCENETDDESDSENETDKDEETDNHGDISKTCSVS